MMRSLAFKLTVAFLAISLLGAALASLFARWTTVQEFERLVLEQTQGNFLADVTDYYVSHGSWAGVTEYFRARAESPQTQRPNPPAQPRRDPALPAQSTPPVPIILIDQNGYVIHPVPPYRLGDYVDAGQRARGVPVVINGQAVGTILPTGSLPALSAQEQQYLNRTNQALLVSALVVGLIALLSSILLARTLTRPLRELTGALHVMAAGSLGVAVPVRSRDEVGELSAAFNRMSADLARANRLRRQMTADIAHDLRTPLTVIGGYIESLRDGVLPPTAARFEVMYQEVQHLQRLVDDLRTLSLADAGDLKLDRQPLPPRELLEQAAAAFQHRAEQQGVSLLVQAEPGLPEIAVDELRMAQVLGNLLGNALRYTPGGGRIVLGARQSGGRVGLTVQDSGSGIPAEALPHIFERFYRADASRASATESGLGLAIAKSLVEAHGGAIAAASAGEGQGSMFTIDLPAL